MFYAAMVVVLFLAGAAASGRFARIMGRDDPGFIVIDEVCGQMIALFLVSPSLLNLALSFALFRFFDIIKPFPVRNAEGFPGGWGIMADDVVAGVFAALVLRLALIII
jgi:phosphatidylglycerophosphatase A